MKWTEVVPLKFCSELINYGLEGMLCWSWQETIDSLVSTLGKILSSVHPSYTKILMQYGNTKNLVYIRKICYMNKIYSKLRHSLPSICEIEINRKILTLLQQTWNNVVAYLYRRGHRGGCIPPTRPKKVLTWHLI